MALQTQTFSLGSFEWKNPVSNAYILDLIITEESTDISANTSQISYVLQLRSGANNRFAGYLGASVVLGGTESARDTSIGIDAYYNHTYRLLSGNTTVGHNDDGSLELNVKANIWQAVSNSFAPPSMELTGTMTLTEIPRTSVPTAMPSPVAVGGSLIIRTNRKSDVFTHSLSYTFGQATAQIAEDVADSFEWTIPEELAAQIPNAATGWGKILCTTFNGADEIGSAETDFVVTIPQNDTTRPGLQPELQPVNTGLPDTFAGMYIQGKSKLQVALNAYAWYSDIVSQSVQVQGLTFSGEDPIQSSLLLQPGTCDVVCKATDGRGYTGNSTAQITVMAYRKPSVTACSGLSNVICCRSDAEGNPNKKGTRILLKARRAWYDLSGNNKCTLRYRLREEGGAWPTQWQTLLAATDTTNEVQTVLADVLSTKLTYQIQLSALDTLGEEGVLTMPIGTANTPLHLGRGGKNIGLGRYCNYDHENAVDVGWDMFLDGHANGMYWDVATLSGTTFTVQSCFATFEDAATAWQTLLLWGSGGGQPVHGTVVVGNDGSTAWDGTGGVSVAAGSDGKITITIPQAADDQLVLMSTHKFDMN